MGYFFSLLPITEKQLEARLETRRNRNRAHDSEVKHWKSKQSTEKDDKGPTAVYVTINLLSTLPKISGLSDLMNIDLRKSNVQVSVKSLQ